MTDLAFDQTPLAGPPTIDWRAAEAAVIDHLVNLIRIDTSNPPGNELAAATYLRAVLRNEGIEPTVLEMAQGRANLVARLKGDGSKGPLLFLGHTDVVPAEPDGWSHGPFNADVADGFIWGRGAVDMKHIVAAMLTAFLLAKRHRLPLRRDLIFAATADEESAGESGAGWLFRSHPELVNCEVAITEGGQTLTYNGVQYFLAELGQKGWLTVDLVRRSRAQHSSIATRANCLYAIGEILERLSRRRFPHRATRYARAFFEQLAADQRADGETLLGLLNPAIFESALERLACEEEIKSRFEAMLHSHATPTLLRGGETTWAVPERATLRLAGRVLPGESQSNWLDELEQIIGPLGEYSVSDFDPGIESPRGAEALDRLTVILGRHSPGTRVLPSLSAAGGDARHPLLAGATTFCPFHLRPDGNMPDMLALAHGRNERISSRNLLTCTAIAWDVLCMESNIPLGPVPEA